jgi:FtsH-binding integral membrane protein
MDFLKTMTGKVVSGLVGLAVIAAGISWWQMDPNTRQMLVSGTGKIISWLGIVLIVPWATFFVIGRVAKYDNNLAGAALVGAYTLIEALLLGWLFEWHVPGATAWTFFILGGLFAAVYNLFTCDWIAEKV